MILYNSKREMVAISPQIIDFLGFDSIDELNEKIEDIADLFVKKPGYIYNFQNFSWIDYILVNHLKKPKVIIKTLTNEVETVLLVNELLGKDEDTRYFCISFKEIMPIAANAEFLETESITLPKEEIKESTPEEISIEDLAKTTEKEPEITIDFENIEKPKEKEVSIDFDNIFIKEEPKVETTEQETTVFEKEKLYNIKEAANELGIDESFIKELLQEFISQSYEIEPQLKEAIKNQDFTLAHNLIHKLKGAAANLRIKEANKILSNTSGIDDKNLLNEYVDNFYNFIEKLNNEFGKKEKKISITPIQKEEKRVNLYDLSFAAKELGLDEETISDFVSEYIKESLKKEEEIKNTIEKKDIGSLKNIAHKLKGTAINLRIEKAVQTLDKILKSNNIENIKTIIDDFYNYIKALASELNIKIEKTEKTPKIDIENSAKEIGLDIDIYKELLKDFIQEIKKMISLEDEEKIKKEARKLRSVSENLRVLEVNEILNEISNGNSIKENINSLKNFIEKLNL